LDTALRESIALSRHEHPSPDRLWSRNFLLRFSIFLLSAYRGDRSGLADQRGENHVRKSCRDLEAPALGSNQVAVEKLPDRERGDLRFEIAGSFPRWNTAEQLIGHGGYKTLAPT
jgi:hypothetical protein